MTAGLLFGKFYPLHAGHLLQAERLRAEVDELVVCVLAAAQESIPLETRMRWVRDSVRGATVVGGYDEAPEGDTPEIWDAHLDAITAALAGRRVDVLATPEWYGPETARRLGAQLLAVDPERATLPVSATAIRADPGTLWWALPAAVRADLCKRVYVVGAESTGTTTLATALGSQVQEYGRDWSGFKGEIARWRWESAEFDLIARGQAALEDAAARLGGPVLVADTDVLATGIWHERYCGTRSATVESLAAQRVPALYLLTSDEGVPWEDDGMRDGENERAWMTQRFRERCAESGAPWVELTGPPEVRLERARAAIAEVTRWAFAEPIGYAS